jgi:serine/threonine protein kinase/tetratricopeptide (TPR) repeat protein
MTPDRWQKLKEVFESALGRAPDERSAFLEQVCDGDEPLRREVESLLASYEEGESILERPAVALAAKSLAEPEGKLLTGQTINHYQIVREIGSGGMAEVYLAQDTRLGRSVALKLLPTYLSKDEDRLRRFEQEARAASALNHPNVCVIHEVGETVEGRHYIALEYIDGVTLRQHMTEARLKLSEVLDVAVQIASSLAAAHEVGVVHRDIKPENVMMRRDGYVKVLDFGLAKLTEQKDTDVAAPAGARPKTDTGVVMGTSSYMSPEQARGLSVDARTDIWSLGVVIYEMVSGRAPFEGATTSDVIVSILEREPPPLAHPSPEAPAELQRIISKTLHKDPGQRHQTAKDLLIDLKALAARLSHPQPPAMHSPSIAVLPFVNMSGDPENEYFCDGLAAELLNALAKIKALRVVARTSAFFFKGKNTDVREIGQKLNVGAVLEGSVRKVGNRLRITAQLVDVADGYYLWSERYDRDMEDIFDLQDEISMAIVDALKVKLMGAEKAAVVKRYTDNAEAYQLYLKGRYFWYKFPAPGYEKAREYFQKSIDADPTYALGYCGLADYFGMAAALGIMRPDEGWVKCEAAMNKALELDDTLPEIYNTKAGISFIYYRDWPATERAFKRAIDLNPDFAEAHHHYGLCLASYGRTEEALAAMRRALQLDSLSAHRNLWEGRVLFWSGRYGEAIEQYYRTLDLDGNFAWTHEWLGDAYEQKGQNAEAIAAWSRALVLRGKGKLAALVDHTFAESGFNAAVRALALQRLERLNEKNERGAYVPAMAFVTQYLRLGDREQTTLWLAKAVLERNRWVLEVCIDPRYESLRSDAQFVGLARQIGFTR